MSGYFRGAHPHRAVREGVQRKRLQFLSPHATGTRSRLRCTPATLCRTHIIERSEPSLFLRLGHRLW